MRGAENVAKEQWRGRGKKQGKRLRKRGGKASHSGQYRRTERGELRRGDGERG